MQLPSSDSPEHPQAHHDSICCLVRTLRRNGPGAKDNRRPGWFASVTQTSDSRPHSLRERDDVDAAIVLIGCDKRQPLFNALDGRTPLACLRVINPYAELKKDTDEIRLVTHSLEEELLEEITRLQVFAFIEERQSPFESGIVAQFQLSARN